MQREQTDGLRFDVHPDLVLLSCGEKRGIRCLALEDVSEAQLRELAVLGAFCVYGHGGRGALLYAQDAFAGMDALTAKLQEMGLSAGLSGPFALAASARGCMLKAQLALETGRVAQPGQTLYPMERYNEAALVCAAQRALHAQGFSCEDFVDASLAQMALADAKRDTRYLASLDAYLSCGMDMKRAAQHLGVHRNTLAYRLERMQALFALDLKDVNTCFELLFSLWLMKKLPSDCPQQDISDAPFDRARAQAMIWRCVERGAQALGEAEGEPFACVLLSVGISHLADAKRAKLMLDLGALGAHAAIAFDEDVLFVVLNPLKAQAWLASALPYLEQLSCPAASTQAFSCARMAQRAMLGRMALCAASGTQVFTRDMGSTLFFMAMERSAPLAPYVCEDVIRVMDDDAQKGTALSRSLYAYLLHFRDMRRAAQHLGMHRNTMEYHVRKIDALIGSREGDADRFMMMCTYKMLALPETGRFGLC